MRMYVGISIQIQSKHRVSITPSSKTWQNHFTKTNLEHLFNKTRGVKLLLESAVPENPRKNPFRFGYFMIFRCLAKRNKKWMRSQNGGESQFDQQKVFPKATNWGILSHFDTFPIVPTFFLYQTRIGKKHVPTLLRRFYLTLYIISLDPTWKTSNRMENLPIQTICIYIIYLLQWNPLRQ